MIEGEVDKQAIEVAVTGKVNARINSLTRYYPDTELVEDLE